MNDYNDWDELLDAINDPDALATEAEQAFYDDRFAAIALGEIMGPIAEAFREFKATLNDVWRDLVEKVKPALDKLSEIFTHLDDPSPAAPKTKPRNPPRIDLSNVNHTRTKPPKPATIYRRRTP